MLCPNCESVNRDGAKFCDECGFPLPAERPQEPVAAEYEPTPDEEALYGEGASSPEFTAAIEPELTAAIEPKLTAEVEPELAGIDRMDGVYGERLVDPGYQEPKADWRDGNTMQMPRVEGEEAPRSKDFLASSATKQKTSKKLVIGIIAAVVLLAAAVVFATYQMQLWGGKAVPDVRGMTEADATSVLEGDGFKVRSTQVKSDDTEGLVLLMDPTAGSRIGEGEEVVIHIATGRSIPAVVGKTQEEAKAAIGEEGYENVKYVTERSDQPEGTVLSISPEPGTRAKSTIAVTVKVAEPYVVPDTSSLGLDATEDAIHEAGLAYDIAYIDTQDYPDGAVIGTDPVAGTKVKSDTVVLINVARARGAQLTELAKSVLAPGEEIVIGGTNYIVNSIVSLNYLGNDQVAFTVNARPHTVFFGVYVEGDMQQVSGTISFTPDNQVSAITA